MTRRLPINFHSTKTKHLSWIVNERNLRPCHCRIRHCVCMCYGCTCLGCHLVSGGKKEPKHFDCCFDFSCLLLLFWVHCQTKLNGRTAFPHFFRWVTQCRRHGFYVAKVFNSDKCNAHADLAYRFILPFGASLWKLHWFGYNPMMRRIKIKSADKTRRAEDKEKTIKNNDRIILLAFRFTAAHLFIDGRLLSFTFSLLLFLLLFFLRHLQMPK